MGCASLGDLLLGRVCREYRFEKKDAVVVVESQVRGGRVLLKVYLIV